MDPFILGTLSAIWLGILTSISPCPMATNIAAVSYIGKRLATPKQIFWAGLLYMLGRTMAYVAIAVLLVAAIMSVSELANFLQTYINIFLGPILIIAGIFLLGFIKFNFPGGGISENFQRRVESYGIWGAGLLGIVFALSFCPISAALFFGSLIPLSIKFNSGFILPALYGIGTGIPVVLFSFALALGTRYVGTIYNRLTQFEKWSGRITGIIFVMVGIYYVLIYIMNIDLGW